MPDIHPIGEPLQCPPYFVPQLLNVTHTPNLNAAIQQPLVLRHLTDTAPPITNPSHPLLQPNTLMTQNKVSPAVPVKATKIPMTGAHAGATTDTHHHCPRTSADPQAHNIHEMNNRIDARSKARNEQSLAMSSTICIDGQQYRTAANVVSCRHIKLTNQAQEFDAGFLLHYTETLGTPAQFASLDNLTMS